MKNANNAIANKTVTTTATVATKKAIVPLKTPTNKKAVVVVSPIAPKKEDTKTPASKKVELVTIANTNYGYYRYWVKNIMIEAGVLKYRFIKNKENYDGVLAVSKAEVEKAKAALAKYKKDNPDTVAMWS